VFVRDSYFLPAASYGLVVPDVLMQPYRLRIATPCSNSYQLPVEALCINGSTLAYCRLHLEFIDRHVINE
jgi:hypothetical protein